MKAVSPALSGHLEAEVSTLATCWSIRRTDGMSLHFTDHDRDILFDGDLYRSRSGYSRTAIANDAGMNVDNLDVEVVLDSEAITEAALRAGLFDHAEVRVFLVNWADPSMGALRLRRGWFGEVTLTEHGMFRTELRGLAQALQQRIGELYGAECRADLGDGRCRVPLAPPVLARDTSYEAGDIVRVATDPPPSMALDLVNGGFDTGDLTGWTTVSGTPDVKTSNGAVLPQAGTHFVEGAGAAAFELSQVVAFPAQAAALVDAGGWSVAFACWRATSAGSIGDDEGRVLVEVLDVDDLALATVLDTGLEGIAPVGTWAERAATVAVPAGGRKLRIRLLGDYSAGSVSNAAFDSVSARLVTDAPSAAASRFENRIYRCTGAGTTAPAQPVYDPTVGAETTDGGATFAAQEAWTRHGAVVSVTDRRTYGIAVDEARAADGWFAGGVLTWESGDNAGRAIEVKAWDGDMWEVELYLAPGYAVEAGDRFTIHPGCDKHKATCVERFDNILNFRGEPYVPGVDAMMAYPDASD